MSTQSDDRLEETAEPKADLPVPTAPTPDQAGADAAPRPKLPTQEELLLRLDKLAGATALGIFTPAKANSIRGTYHVMLEQIKEEPRTGGPTVADEHVLAILRRQPELLKLVADFVEPGQLALIMQEANQ